MGGNKTGRHRGAPAPKLRMPEGVLLVQSSQKGLPGSTGPGQSPRAVWKGSPQFKLSGEDDRQGRVMGHGGTGHFSVWRGGQARRGSSEI